MKDNQTKTNLGWRIVQVSLIVFTALACIKNIWVSLDIDESYAVAQSYRLACGDKLFRDMWEPHQLSAFLSAWFIRPYLFLFHTTDYLVIYLRVIGMLIHTGMGIWLYRCLKSQFHQKICFLVLMLHLNFFPKWVVMPEFELMHYWFLLAVFLLLYSYFERETPKITYPLLAGVCLFGSMMSYPTMLLLYPVYFLGICVLEKQKHGRNGKKIFGGGLWFTLGAAAVGIGFLGYLLSYQSFAELQKNISYIFLDESHIEQGAVNKWVRFVKELGQNCLSYILYFAVALAIVFPVQKIRRKPFQRGSILAVLYLTAFEMQLVQIAGSLFGNKNQFYMQIRYLAFLIPAVYLGICSHKKMAELFYLCVLPAILTIPLVLLMTNMSVEVTYSRAFIGVLGSILMLFLYLAQEQGEKLYRSLFHVLCLSLLAGFFVCRLVLLRVTGCLPVTVKAPLEQMAYGPAKGIYVLQEQAWIWNGNIPLLEETIKEGDRLLYVGAENLTYLIGGATVAAPSTNSTAVYNEMYLCYWEENPERLPNVVVLDKTFAENPVYRYSEKNEIILNWIEENYSTAETTDAFFLKIRRK